MVYQSFQDDCGKAAIRNLLILLFKSERFATVDLSSSCQSLYEIREELHRFDVIYSSYEVDDFRKIENKMFPIIALVKYNECNHFVVIKKITTKKVCIIDSQFGEYDLSYDEFAQVFQKNILAKEEIKAKQKPEKYSLLTRAEKLSYLIFFLVEFLANVSLIISTKMENGFVISVISLTIILLSVFIQNLSNSLFLKRLDNKVFYPYMKIYKNETDYESLNTIFSRVIKRHSEVVSYSLMSMLLFSLLLLNDYILSILCLIPLLFTILRIPLKKERNKVDLYCSLKEFLFKKLLSTSFDDSFLFLKQAKKKGRDFYLKTISSYLLEFMIDIIFLLFYSKLNNKMNINSMIYYLGISMTLSYGFKKVYETWFERKEEIMAENKLSFPLSIFLLKK